MEETPRSNTLSPNIAALLCYLLMPIACGFPIPGAIMLLIEKADRFVRFHAWQSILLGTLTWTLCIMLAVFGGLLGAVIGFFEQVLGLLRVVVICMALGLWVVCLIKAYQLEAWRIPWVGEWAAKQAGIGKYRNMSGV